MHDPEYRRVLECLGYVCTLVVWIAIAVILWLMLSGCRTVVVPEQLTMRDPETAQCWRLVMLNGAEAYLPDGTRIVDAVFTQVKCRE